MVERFHRPVFVLSEEDGVAQGSGRSLHPFHLLDALESMAELFSRFGGHRQAAGLSMSADRVDEFRERMNIFASGLLTASDFQKIIEVDAEFLLSDISNDCISDILSLGPFGMGNPAPVFAALDLEVIDEPVIMKEKHLRLNLRGNGKPLQVKAWNFASRRGELRNGARVDAVVTFEASSFGLDRGNPPWSATLKDVRPA
jgi:single-stranded-DNA-specific exonuclease